MPHPENIVRNVPFFGLIAIVAAVFVAYGIRKNPTAAQGTQVRSPAWVLRDLDGKERRSDEFKDKVVVLDFWATWCGPCRAEIPGYVELQKKYADKGLVIVGASLDEEGPAVVRRFAEKLGINYVVVMADEKVVGTFGGVDAIPTTFIIDRKGIIRDMKIGAMPTAEFEKRLLPILTE